MQHQNADELWEDAIVFCQNGHVLASRDGGCKEQLFYHGTLGNAHDNFVTSPVRKLSATYACAELLWYLTESDDARMICAYAPSYERFTTSDCKAFGHYGARWRWGDDWGRYYQGRWLSALDCIMQTIAEQPNTRQAVLLIWRSGDLVHGYDKGRDVPCTLGLQFVRRFDRVFCSATMRSNDVWLGMPYDVFAFSSIQKLVAHYTCCDLGSYHHQVGSMHFYDRDMPKWRVEAPAEDRPRVSPRLETIKMPYRDALTRALKFEVDARMGKPLDLTLLRDVFYVLKDSALICAARWAKDFTTAMSLCAMAEQETLREVALNETNRRWSKKAAV